MQQPGTKDHLQKSQIAWWRREQISYVGQGDRWNFLKWSTLNYSEVEKHVKKKNATISTIKVGMLGMQTTLLILKMDHYKPL